MFKYLVLILLGMPTLANAESVYLEYRDFFIGKKAVNLIAAVDKLSSDTTQVVLVISSIGGDIDQTIVLGERLLALENKGIVISCIAQKQVYSAAFYLFTKYCSKRFIVRGTKLNFHEVYYAIFIPLFTKTEIILTEQDSHDIYVGLRNINQEQRILYGNKLTGPKLSREEVDAAMAANKLWTSEEFMSKVRPGFATIIEE